MTAILRSLVAALLGSALLAVTVKGQAGLCYSVPSFQYMSVVRVYYSRLYTKRLMDRFSKMAHFGDIPLLKHKQR